MSEVILQGESVTKQFGGLVAVKNINFSVVRGEIFGLIGPNGAGKTTLFRLISGVHRTTQGRILFKGANITSLKPSSICHRGIVTTHQVVRPFPDMTVRDNVRVAALYGERNDTQTSEKAVDDVLNFTGLSGKADTRAIHLTLPDRKRLEVGRALATQPEILLLDEVVAGLNPTEVVKTMSLIQAIRDRGVTIFMVEHVMRVVLGICDRVMVMDHGEKIAEGIPREVMQNERVVEAYLGKGSAHQTG